MPKAGNKEAGGDVGKGSGTGWKKRWARRLFWTGVRVYLGLVIVLYFLQNWMIFPGASTQGQQQAVVRAGRDNELVELKTAEGERVVALFGGALTAEGKPDPKAKERPTILFFYGNGMCLADTYEEFGHFRRLGVNVLIPEFVGYGMSSGKPSEKGFYETADAAYEYLLRRPDVDGKKIVPMGWSLGSAVAVDLASRRPVAGLGVFSCFTSMVEMANRVIPFMPNFLLLEHRFENERKIATINCPIFISHGTRDSIIPFAMSGRVARAAKGRPLVVYPIEGADHNNLFDVGGEDLFEAVGGFLKELGNQGNRE